MTEPTSPIIDEWDTDREDRPYRSDFRARASEAHFHLMIQAVIEHDRKERGDALTDHRSRGGHPQHPSAQR